MQSSYICKYNKTWIIDIDTHCSLQKEREIEELKMELEQLNEYVW